MRRSPLFRANRVGLTLIESLVSLLVFGIAAALAVSLFSKYARVVSFEDGHSSWASALVAAERMCQELREARVLTTSSDRVSITKLDPARLSERLDPARPEGETFDPYDDSFMVEVDYRLSQGKMVRTLRRPGQQEVTVSLAEGLDRLQFSEQGNLLRVSLRCVTKTKTHEAELLVERPL